MSTKILLIRHGETAWNADRRLQGHTDIALNEEGQRQAQALGLALAGERLDMVVASDLQRASQTAQAVAGQHGIALRHDAQLRERCYGAFEGMLYSEIAKAYPADYALWQARDIDALMPSGPRAAESFRQFYQRVIGAIGDWARQYRGQTVALVAHGGVLECAYREAVGMSLDSPRDFQVKNASINRFSFSDEKLKLDSWGEVDHLQLDVLDDII